MCDVEVCLLVVFACILLFLSCFSFSIFRIDPLRVRIFRNGYMAYMKSTMLSWCKRSESGKKLDSEETCLSRLA